MKAGRAMAQKDTGILHELHSQLMLAPVAVRRAHAARIEELLLELDPDATYPHAFVYFRATGFQSTESSLTSYLGRDVQVALLAALAELSRDCPREVAEVGEPVHTIAETAAIAGVSERTLHRWRRTGLVTRRYVFPDGHVQVGVRRSALERFAALNPTRATRSRSFTKVNHAEQQRIVREAGRIVAEGQAGISAVAERLAQRFDRAAETIRIILRKHDEEHPQEALFATDRPVTDETRRRDICEAYVQGEPVADLSERHGLSRPSIYRIINAGRARRALAVDAGGFVEDAFHEPDAGERILTPDLRALLHVTLDEPESHSASGGGSPWWECPLSEASEAALFRAYNYTKCLMANLQKDMNPAGYAASALLDEFDAREAFAARLRDAMLHIYGPLVDHVAWQHAGAREAEDLVAEGRHHLREFMDSFDYRGPGRLTSYATLELLKRFAVEGDSTT
jgi:RNA polymerase primary sigma factor